MRKYNYKKNKGITLVALVITIIILLILAGITITQLTQNGLFEKAKLAKDKYEEAEAREKLETVIFALQADKYTKSEYNEGKYIDEKIKENKMTANGDIIIVGDYQFLIDRSVPKIIADLGKGKGQISEDIEISTNETTNSTYTGVTIKIEVISEKEITSITINNQEIKNIEKQDGKYIAETLVSSNGNYNIIAKDTENNINIEIVKVSDITEDMDIYTLEDMIEFRNKVNIGRTFEGRTVRVMDNISLEGSLTNMWISIGTDSKRFKGEFNGNGHTISNIYIYQGSTNVNTALFQYNEGTIKNLTVSGEIYITQGAAGFVYENYGTIENCTNNVNINNSTIRSAAGLVRNNYGIIRRCINNGNILASTTNNSTDGFGGIVGANKNIVEECINTGKVEGRVASGGIASYNIDGGIIKNCVNIGNIAGYNIIGGITAYNYYNGQVYNSYNTASVTGTTNVGGIAGQNGLANWGNGYVYNCYSINKNNIVGITVNSSVNANCYTSGMTAQLLNDGIDNYTDTESTEAPWQEDATPNINNGYPILKWQVK